MNDHQVRDHGMHSVRDLPSAEKKKKMCISVENYRSLAFIVFELFSNSVSCRSLINSVLSGKWSPHPLMEKPVLPPIAHSLQHSSSINMNVLLLPF